MEDVYKSSLKFLTPLSLEQTYKTIVQEAIKLVEGTDGSIFLAKRGRPVRVYASNPKIYKIKPREYGNTYNVYKTKKTIVLPKGKIERVHPEISDIKMKADIMSPLIYRNKSIGVLSLYTDREQKFTKREEEILQTFSPLASLAIRKAQLYDELKKAIETRDLFLSLASHELKTPITTIYIYLQLIERDIKKNRKFEPEWIKTLLDEMVRLTKIVDDLLELSRIRTGKLNYVFEEANIKEIVKRAIVNFHAAHRHQIQLYDKVSEKKSKLVGDIDKLVSVVINILDNAAKHSPLSLPIKLTLRSDGKYFVILVEDGGKGIVKEEIHKVFAGFYKTSDNTKPGMGLGLYLAKQIIDKHKGKIKIRSSVGKGTAVQVLLPQLESSG